MVEVPITDVSSRLLELLERSHGERIFLTRDGKRVAALVSVTELESFEALQAADDLRHALSVTVDTPPTDGIPLAQAVAEWDAKRRTP